MAPDINTMADWATEGYANNGVPRAEYEIPDIVLHGPYTRKIRVLSIGAGVTGIMNAYHIQKHLENVEHVIYEKNEDIGGTWLENRYPGCACDIPSHAYTFAFALNPDWPRFFSYSPDIWKYLDKVCGVWGLRKYMTFNTEVIGCYWQQETGEWLVKLKQTSADGTTRLFEDRCHMLLHGTGILNNFKWPNIEGMEKFKGRIVHTARWPKNYQAEEWKGDRVAVIGSGASSIQTVPTMQPHVKHLDVFVRTGVWFVQIANNFGANHEYTAEQKAEFRDPYKIAEHAKSIEDQVNGLWGSFYKNSKAQAEGQVALKARMREMIKDERLLKGFTPTFGIGCRRITPGDPYMEAIQKPNVDVHFTPVEKIDETGVIGGDGTHRKVDTIVCATGFDVSYRPRFPIIGQNGVDLADKWKVCPEGYLGLAIPEFPNFLTFVGPNWPVENGSVMGPLLYVSQYALQMIKKIQSEYICSIAPKQDVTDAFNEHCQEWVRHTVWTEDCRSWYKNNETGRVNAVWPGSSLHYIEAIRTPRYEDYEIEYLGPARKNRWAFLGMGTVKALVNQEDPSPYINAEAIDPEWMEEVHMDARKLHETKLSELKAKEEQQREKSKENVNNAEVA
ncbi:hypothetical protein LTR10_019743 [Elasticomyces elasticus]|uniref:Sterigmatocystin biosynthesis monooxygenase stcW n=1 Tax=Exophiala sideris TaxID=1016849 RepID=A0ABR0JL82_9EURO|nr:hypothetical protein LTR10_019743 [Elasticomyces elasticus]KAK5032163.1 hypothetical protein LTR13_007380 [Exophiala sideris]KAK5036161.1 hypothetical protein LTS07_001886 [Exophiala sideris]KAK5066544.1 hypothetical protein LTR69_001890 [Exophiala sideris]KAK5180366.1 hypothetical protein LTR44_007123 [Eurotiomycetes sp. CCFEE 6388]